MASCGNEKSVNRAEAIALEAETLLGPAAQTSPFFTPEYQATFYARHPPFCCTRLALVMKDSTLEKQLRRIDGMNAVAARQDRLLTVFHSPLVAGHHRNSF
jgi:hypothetical protein